MIPVSRLITSAAAVALLLSFAGLASGSAAASPSLQATLQSADAPLRIVAFGSSSTQGVGASKPSNAYPAQLQALLDHMRPLGRKIEVINRGIGGEDADDMMRRLQSDVIARHPDLVIWQTGSNDPLRHVPLDRFVRETREGIAAMRKAGIRIILMEPQWCPRLEANAASDSYRDAIRVIGRDERIPVVRRSDLMHDWVRQGLMTPAQMLAKDGLHMTDGGYALLARALLVEVIKATDAKVVAPAALSASANH